MKYGSIHNQMLTINTRLDLLHRCTTELTAFNVIKCMEKILRFEVILNTITKPQLHF